MSSATPRRGWTEELSRIVELFSFLARLCNRQKLPRFVILSVITLGVIGGLSSAGLVALLNHALHHSGEGRGPLVAGFVALCLLLPLARLGSSLLLIRLTQGAVYQLRISLSRQILSAPLRRLEDLGIPRLLATITDDVGTLSGAFSNLPLLCMHIAVVVGCLGYLLWLSWQLFLVVLAFVGIGVFSYRFLVRRGHAHFRSGREEWDRLFQHFRGLTQGTKELKIHLPRSQVFMSDHLAATADSLRGHLVQGRSIYAVAKSWGQVLFFALIGLIVFALQGVGRFETEILSGYALAILFMLSPMELIMNMVPGFSRAAVARDKVESLGLSLASTGVPETWAIGHPVESPPCWERVNLLGVTHAFHIEGQEDRFILGPLDLEIEKGELLFITGGNGSGKTTLAKLLLGLYRPQSGHLRIDGDEVTDENVASYRQLFSVVFSDFFLFEDLLGLEAPDLDQRARHYLAKLRLDHKVRVRRSRLSTLDLSQGQRKRLALLTAYLEDRPIYLFDEWAADQDPEFKDLFYRQLLPELKARSKTVIVISHDDRYYGIADRILKLEYGRIKYDGPVSELPSWSPAGAVRV